MIAISTGLLGLKLAGSYQPLEDVGLTPNFLTRTRGP